MINVTFYNFSKKKNSTALPNSGTASSAVSVLLKDNCSQESPILELNSSDPDNYNSYNYVYIPFWQRYYFVSRKEVDTGSRLLIYCEEDYMGSAASQIRAITGAYIEYSSIVTNDVIDRRIPEKSTLINTVVNATLPDTTFTQNGCSIISSTGNNTSGLFILSNANQIFTLFDGIDWTNETVSGTTTEEILLSGFERMISVGNQFFTKEAATRNLRNAFSLPWVVHGEAIGDEVEDLKIGSFPTGKTVYKVANKIVTDAVTITIPWSFSDWRRCDRYCDLLIYLPLFGIIKLPVNSLKNDSTMRVSYVFSYDNGDVSYQIEGMQSNHIVSTGTTNASAPLAVGNSNINNSKLATSVATGASAIALLGGGVISGTAATLGALGVVGSSAMQTIDALGGQALGGGGYGGFACAALDKVIHLYQISKTLTVNPATMGAAYGYPYNGIGSLANLSGYTKLNGYTYAGNGTQSEKDAITQMLNNGFYLE